MKIIILSLVILLVFAKNSIADTLDFKQCVEITLSQNPSIKISDSKIKQSQYSFSASKASRLPQVSLSLTGSRTDSALNVFGMKLQQRQASFNDFGFAEFNNDATVIPNSLNKPDAYNDINTRVEVLVPIWNGGKISAFQAQAYQMLLASKSGNIAVQQFLTFNVYRAYEGVHTARAYIKVAKQAVEAAKSYAKTTQDLFDNGVVVKSEVLSSKVHLAEAQTSLEVAKSQENISLDNLKMLMNRQDMEVLDVGKRITMTLPFESLLELLDKSSESNTKLRSIKQQTLSYQAAVRKQESGLYPKVNLVLRNDWHSEELTLGESAYTVAGVVSWKITDFGMTKDTVDQAQELANQQKLLLSAKKNELKFKVLKAWRNLKIAEKKEYSNRVSQEQAKEAQNLMLKRYKNGISTLTEVLISQTRLDKSRADLVQATYDANIQRATLRLLTGTMDVNLLDDY